MSTNDKLAIIGLDCAAPELVFDLWLDELPHLRSLCEKGSWGKLRSTTPPITVPAWSCMMSGRDPGELGIYGFRNRKDYSYDGLFIATSTAVKVPRAWDILSEAGKKVIVIGVPGTFPPTPVNGSMVSCFLTPTADSVYTYPAPLKQELEQKFGPYRMDVQNFRSEEKDRILEEIYQMTDQHFAMAEHLLTTRPWDFFMMVEMGTDRIHHAFWQFFDPNHRRHEKGNKYQEAIREYYHHVDSRIGALLTVLGEDTPVMVVSDHGAKKMDGGVCVNEWLIREGYLTVKGHEVLTDVTPIAKMEIDWDKTSVWGEGGYYSRIFLNVKGREPKGTIEQDRYEAFRDALKRKIEDMVDHEGNPLGNRVFKPQEVYRTVNGTPPDLIVYFGDLHWRSVGSLGHGSVYTFENDTGPDDANHAPDGIFILREPDGPRNRELEGLMIYDVSATALDRLGVPVPPEMQGRVVKKD